MTLGAPCPQCVPPAPPALTLVAQPHTLTIARDPAMTEGKSRAGAGLPQDSPSLPLGPLSFPDLEDDCGVQISLDSLAFTPPRLTGQLA